MLDNILYLRGKDYTLFVAYPHHWSGRMMQIRCMMSRLYTRAYRRSETRMFLDKVNHQARIRINRFHHSHALLSCSICASISSSLRRHSGGSGLSRRRCKSAAALPRSGYGFCTRRAPRSPSSSARPARRVWRRAACLPRATS